MSLLETVIKTAKEAILEQGKLMPILHVEYKNHEVALVFMIGAPDDALDRKKHFFFAGRKVGMDAPGRKVNQLIYADEAWMSSHPIDAPGPYPYKRPSDDPNRKEVLLIQVVDVSSDTVKQSMHSYEMLRGDGTLDLLADSEPPEEVYCPMLIAFLAGLCSATMNDKQFKKFLKRQIRQMK